MSKKVPRPTQVEARLRSGASIISQMTGDPERPVSYMFADTGRAARADICARLIADGVMSPVGDGLFPGVSQTYRAAT